MEQLLHDLRRQHRRALWSLLCIVSVIIFGSLGIAGAFARSWGWVLVVPALAGAGLLVRWRKGLHCHDGPYILPVRARDAEQAFRAVCAQVLPIDAQQTAFRLNRGFQFRILVTKMDAFSKEAYDRERRTANRLYQKTFRPAQWVSREKGHRMLRLNLVQVQTMNDPLRRYLSRSAARNLSRVEGILTAALADGQLWIPPLNGDVDLAEVQRYRAAAELLMNTLENATTTTIFHAQ